MLAPVERAQNFTHSGVKTHKCQNFGTDHYNSKRLKCPPGDSVANVGDTTVFDITVSEMQRTVDEVIQWFQANRMSTAWCSVH